MLVNIDSENVDLLQYVKNNDHQRKNLCTFEQMITQYKKQQFNKNTLQINGQRQAIGTSAFKSNITRINPLSPMKQRKNTFTGQMNSQILKNTKKKKQSADMTLVQNSFLPIVKQNSRKQLQKSTDGNITTVNQYDTKEIIGRGAFADVKLCMNKITKQIYAMKILSMHKLKKKMFSRHINEDPQHAIRREIAILQKLSHPHICKLFEVIQNQEKEQLYLIMQYCQKGTINMISTPGMGSQQKVLKIFSQKQVKKHIKALLSALDYLHNQIKVAHRDIKPENLLLNKQNNLKLIDFGLATFDQMTDNKAGTRIMMGPETFSKDKYDPKISDIWCLGITLLILVTGKVPYKDQNTEFELHKTISNYVFKFDMEIMSEHLKRFLWKCLQKDPKKRANVKQLLNEPWICDEKLNSQQDIGNEVKSPSIRLKFSTYKKIQKTN